METKTTPQSKEVRTYQLTYILPPTITEEAVAQRRNEITQQLTEKGANVTEGRDASKKKLAYPIAGQTYGFMGEIQFWASSEALPAIQQAIKHIDDLTRFMITYEKPRKTQQRVRPSINKTAGAIAENQAKTTSHEIKEAPAFAKSYDEAREAPKQPTEITAEKTEGFARVFDQQEQPKKETHFKEKISIEDIDKRLDEIMKNI
ncbi:MAG: 30S ribosomal protein S6 [Candidatus Spechtbacteria bacterium]|nr:30S ribosomal protein S6 [Candidatus Spechtbacteria bacterium]